MIEKKIIKAKKDEFATKEFIKKEIGKGKISSIKIERTPIGEKIILRTSKPGLVIGKRGENIQDLSAKRIPILVNPAKVGERAISP